MKLLRLRFPLRLLLAAVVASAALAPATFAQGLPPSGPISLVIAYRAKPTDRPALRAVMADAGVAQLERWKAKGLFADYDLFFSILPAPGPTGDLTLILRFSHFTDLANWAKIEQTSAGGLPSAARMLAEPVSTDLADLDWERPPTKGPHPSLYVLFPYVLKTDTGTYRAYTTAKTVPQLDVWIKRGAITGFQMYMCHTESGGTWGSLLVMDYTSYLGLGSQSTVEPEVRQLLSKDPDWKKWMDASANLRTMHRPTIVDRLNGG